MVVLVHRTLQTTNSVTKEKSLETYHIAVPVPRRNDRSSQVRMLLLSASDLRSPDDGLARIERLYHLDGGHHVGIVFLLNERGGKENGMIAYMELQARCVMLREVHLPLG